MDRKYDNKVTELQNKNNQKGLSKLERYKNDLASNARKEVRQSVKKELNQKSRHDEVVGKIGTLFLDDEIINETGYRLKTYEPLYEVPLKESGYKIADLLIYNSEKNNAFIFEVKTGSLSGAFSEMESIKQTLHEKQDKLERIIGDNYSEATYEFGLIIDQKNISGTIKDHVENSHEQNVTLYLYQSNTLHLHGTWTISDKDFEKQLKQGIYKDEGSSSTITPNSHEFNILHNTLIEIFRKNLIADKNKPKIFSKKEFEEAFFELVTITQFQEDSDFGKALKRRVENILEEGLEFNIIKERSENKYKIYVQGKKDYQKLISNIRRKWINEYVEKNWEKRAERNAYLKFENEKREETKTLDDYP
ncbi:MAG: hypothetical protein ACOC5T_07255 [Elusimicrobiota bacterium]